MAAAGTPTGKGCASGYAILKPPRWVRSTPAEAPNDAATVRRTDWPVVDRERLYTGAQQEQAQGQR